MSEKVRKVNERRLPKRGEFCVYKLLRGGTIVYVGQSKNLSARVKSHKNDGIKIFDEAWYTSVESKYEMDCLEMHLIAEHLPEYNINLDLRLMRLYQEKYSREKLSLEWKPYFNCNGMNDMLQLVKHKKLFDRLCNGDFHERGVLIKEEWLNEGMNLCGDIALDAKVSCELFKNLIYNLYFLEEKDLRDKISSMFEGNSDEDLLCFESFKRIAICISDCSKGLF